MILSIFYDNFKVYLQFQEYYLPFFSWPGVTPVYFLKIRIKVELSRNPARSAASTTLTPVSYTHLDVYKRQRLNRGTGIPSLDVPGLFSINE